MAYLEAGMSNRSLTRITHLAVLLLAFALRVYRLGYQELRGDEVFGYFFSLRPVDDIVRATIELHEPHPVASYFVEKAWLGVAGQSEFALRFVSVWFSLLAVALLYRLGRRLNLTPPVATIAMLLMSISPYVIWHAQDARMYSMSLALTTASTLLMLEWLAANRSQSTLREVGGATPLTGIPVPTSRRVRWVYALAYIAVSLLALHTHYFAAFVLVAQFIFVMSRGLIVRDARRTLLPWLLIQGAVGLLYLPWLLRVRETISGYVGNGDSPALVEMFRRALTVFAAGESTPPPQHNMLAIIAALLLLIGLLRLLRSGRRGVESGALLVLYLLVPLGATWYSAQQRPIFNERYLVAAATPFFLLIAAIFQPPATTQKGDAGTVTDQLLRITSAVLLSVMLINSLISLQRYYTDPFYSKTRGWRELAVILADWSAELSPDQARLAENFPDPTLWYYYEGPLEHIVLPPAPHDRAGAAESVTALAESGVQRIIIPLQPAPNWDDGAIAADVLSDRYTQIVEEAIGPWPVQAYVRAPELTPRDDRFANGVTLAGSAVSPDALHANGLLAVFLDWRLDDAALTGGEKVFVQLIGPDGALVGQNDRQLDAPPTAKNGDTESGDPVAAYGILLPDHLPLGAYQLIVGLYDPSLDGAPRIPTEDGADHVRLATFETR